MPKPSETKENDLGDASADLIRAAQGVRRAVRGRVVGLAKEALGTADKLIAALGDL